MTRAFAVPLLALAVSACAADGLDIQASLDSTAPGALTHVAVAVTGPGGFDPPEELVLEIGDTAWSGYGGVVGIQTAESVQVRLVGRQSCRSYVSFSAPPGTSWVIRFADDGGAGVEDWTGRPMDGGPALGEARRSGCPG